MPQSEAVEVSSNVESEEDRIRRRSGIPKETVKKLAITSLGTWHCECGNVYKSWNGWTYHRENSGHELSTEDRSRIKVTPHSRTGAELRNTRQTRLSYDLIITAVEDRISKLQQLASELRELRDGLPL